MRRSLDWIIVPWLLAAVAIALSGCATAPQELSTALSGVVIDFTKVTLADAQAASAMAAVAKDPEAPFRKECWDAVAVWVGTIAPPTPLPQVLGVMSGFELAAEADRSLRTSTDLLPQAVRSRCAVLVLSAEEFLGRVGLKVAPLPGLGALAPK